jgi:hypothetical protein
MEYGKKIFSQGDYRIMEYSDSDFCMSNLKGDCFNPEVNPDIHWKKLAHEERVFEAKVYNEGVFGYALEKWNPEVDAGWVEVDACWGFIGPYSDTNNHYIVNELKSLIEVK